MTDLRWPVILATLFTHSTEECMTATADKQTRTYPRRSTKRAVPAALIYEQWAGKPVYYKGYRDVLAGKKPSRKLCHIPICRAFWCR